MLSAHYNGDFKAVSFNAPSREWLLNPLGVWIHSLVGQGIDEAELVKSIQSQYSELSSEDIQLELASFYESELLFADQKSDSGLSSGKSLANGNINSLSVCYRDRSIVELKEDYLLWVFWNVADHVVVVSNESDADIIIFEYDAPVKKLKNKIYVELKQSAKECSEAAADLIFCAEECLVEHTPEKWYRVPIEMFTQYVPNSQVIESLVDQGLKIERTAARLTYFLCGEHANYYDQQQGLVSIDSHLESDPLLTIGMATFDDYDGVYFSLVSLQIHHPDVFYSSEIVILDNNPRGPSAKLLRELAEQNPNVRYEPYEDKNSTAVRDILFRIAKADWVLCMDCHVMYPTGVLDKLVQYIQSNPASDDILQGPILSDAGKPNATHFDEIWSKGMYGQWGWDERASDIDAEPFEIPMQGLGMFVARKAAWPGLNPKFVGFGGEEGYIHEKFRQAGGRSLCLPFLRWAHRFGRVNSVTYENRWEDRISNYLVAFDEIGYDTESVKEHFSQLTNPQHVAKVELELGLKNASPVHNIEHAVCINLDHQTERWTAMSKRFEHHKIADKVRRFSAVSTPESHHIGCTLSHRRIIESAKKYAYESVLVFEDDAMFLDGFSPFLARALQELEEVDWKVLYLGAAERADQAALKSNGRSIKKVAKKSLSCSHAVLYHNSVYDQILNDIPANEIEVARWLKDNFAIDQYLSKLDKCFLTSPRLVTQPFLLKHEDLSCRNFYR